MDLNKLLERNIHIFENGVKVFDDHILEDQRKRYNHRNVHEEDEEDIFKQVLHELDDHPVLLSVGSAIGYYAILARKIREDVKVHCFEPLPRHFKYLNDNLRLNFDSVSGVTTHELGIYTSHSYVELKDQCYGSYITGHKFSNSWLDKLFYLFPVNGYQNREEGYFKIKTIPLVDAIRLTKSRNIDLIQMDIQGLESEVLHIYFKNNKGYNVQRFIIGTHGDEIHNRCKDILLSNNYELIVDAPDTQNQPDGIIYAKLGDN